MAVIARCCPKGRKRACSLIPAAPPLKVKRYLKPCQAYWSSSYLRASAAFHVNLPLTKEKRVVNCSHIKTDSGAMRIVAPPASSASTAERYSTALRERSLGTGAGRRRFGWRRSTRRALVSFDHPLTAGDISGVFPASHGANMRETRIVVGPAPFSVGE